ncbi:DUF6714 family protein [Methylomicrobium sp. RS1]|jgi:hypothetical protein|uniref:DUF6714 family protein n=1 Tax=Candidatus Methylomicrobium oryzae TaxID=2802053 RepID=UPI0019231337|nr:DUF6714 family protein [Methylomicrobium sp. RS1]MBL1265208.1 hypothetical protein [Methylomicrobium sp. RS1]
MPSEKIRAEISRRAYAAFQADALSVPPMTLRGGYAEDSYDIAPPPDPVIDALTDAYLEAYTFWGLAYLDPASWRHYLPSLIAYAFRHMDDPHMVVEGLLHNLRPPDREPPRLASLTAAQEAVIVAFLEEVAFSEDSANQGFAIQVLEEWWIPDALYRKR